MTKGEDDPMTANRRRQLRRWVDAKCGGVQSVFVASTVVVAEDGEETQVNAGEISGLLNKKSFGERRARNLEGQAGMPANYLDSTSDPNSDTIVRFVAEPAARSSATASSIVWPFRLASYKRLTGLRPSLGIKRYNEAIHYMDRYLDVMLKDLEREADEKRLPIAA
jgi:hypothetical protein